MTLGISKGSDWRYVAREVGKGSENYYTSAVEAGEPPGRWRGRGAESLGLSGVANDRQLEALFGNFIDPRDTRFEDRDKWPEADRLGRRPMQFKTQQQIFSQLIAAELEPANIEPERAEQLWHQAGTQVREAVHFFDATYSPSKSVSVLYTSFMSEAYEAKQRGDDAESALWESRARLVEDAVWDASGEMIRWMEDKAGFSRAGYHGAKLKSGESTGRWIDSNGMTVASFLQHTARPVDGVEAPQLHVHNLILNRIECADGKFRTLDGKAVYQERAAAGAVADRVVQARLQRDLGVTFAYDPQSKSFEVKGISRDVRDVFSARRKAITAVLPEYVAAFERRMGREPSTLELSELAQRATLKTRQAKLPKARATSLERKVEKWTEQAREHTTTTLSDIARGCIDQRSGNTADRVFNPAQVIEQAVTSVEGVKSTWTRSDLIMHLHRHLPSELETLDPRLQDRMLSELADAALAPDPERVGTPDEIVGLSAPDMVAVPQEFRLQSGESAFHRPGSNVYSTRRLLDAEASIEEAARAGNSATAVPSVVAESAVADVNEQLRRNDPSRSAKLSDDQANILRGVLSSGARTEVIVGPAGTGKSFIMGQLADQWEQRTEGRVIGLTSAQSAANVLADEGIARTSNIKKWLDVQFDIDSGEASQSTVATWRLRRGDMVIVDEASMVDTFSLAQIQERIDKAGAKLVLVGDHEQLGAVGAGGGFILAQESADQVYELKEVRRFRAQWEKEASLGLREGKREAIQEYDNHGRLRKCANLDEAYDAAADYYAADIAAGRKAYLIGNSNEEANELGMRVRERLVDFGLVEERGVQIGKDGATAVAGVGDVVQARRNQRYIGNYDGEYLVNRGRYAVTATGEDGSLTVQALADDGTLGAPIEVPAGYARKQMSLAYASTQHGAQGGTGYGGYGIFTPSTSAQAGYVMSTRGTDSNLLFVVDDLDAQDSDQIATEPSEDRPERSAAAIVQGVFNRSSDEVSATQTMRDNLADTGSMRVLGHRLYESRRWISGHKWESIVEGALPAGQAERFVDDDARYSVYRLLDTVEALGHDVEDVVRTAATQRELGSADSVAQVLHWRITGREDLGLDDAEALAEATQNTPTGNTYSERVPAGDTAIHAYAREVAESADARARQLGEIAVETPPQWALERLGPVPEDPLERDEWIQATGTVEAYREAYGLVDEEPASVRPGASPIGKAPGIGQMERREEWYAAWRALGSPEHMADEKAMTDAQLRERADQYEAEKTWAPANVSQELRHTETAMREAEKRALLAEAELANTDATADAERYQELLAERDTARFEHQQLAERHEGLDRIHMARGDWYELTREAREDAVAARTELAERERAREAAASGAKAAVEAEQPAAHDRTAEPTPDQDAVAERELAQAAEAAEVTQKGPELTEAHQQAEAVQDEREVDAQQTPEQERTEVSAEAAKQLDADVEPAARSAQAALNPDAAKQGAGRPVSEKIAEAKAEKDAEQERGTAENAEDEQATSPAVRSLQAAVGTDADQSRDWTPVDLTEELQRTKEANKIADERKDEQAAARAKAEQAKAEQARRARRAAEEARRTAERNRGHGLGR